MHPKPLPRQKSCPITKRRPVIIKRKLVKKEVNLTAYETKPRSCTRPELTFFFVRKNY